ncbi:RNA polymerase sporulation sigma factor SigH [Pseudogracilibacillus sp. SE30717A]|uniref:RNA polymerase sporulation sigma factor SigH n=1 Tax=Pseudogracilibacillus sp. SE30717A TaxID=3098293 RepID=UPI00300E64E8
MSTVKQLERNVPFGSLVDEEVLSHVQQGNETAVEYLIKKYERIVRKKANTYFLIGSDRDDVVQEGLIGLYKAICDYDKDKRSSFRSFAELCITRQIITSIKSATRLKHTPLNSYVSIYKPVNDENSERRLLDTIYCVDSIDPQELLVIREKFRYVQAQLMKALTRLEWDVLYLYLQGCTYEEIAEQLDRQEKSIDNALQRVKKKVEQLIQEKDFAY